MNAVILAFIAMNAAQFPEKCSQHEEYKKDGEGCEHSCASGLLCINNIQLGRNCVCKLGFVRNNEDICVPWGKC
uniref:EGF-like domain-containing protein n=1 Tax=Ascaris lumbricoides TaxID=6252 RepID=A0A0M3ILG6_ASCLU